MLILVPNTMTLEMETVDFLLEWENEECNGS